MEYEWVYSLAYQLAFLLVCGLEYESASELAYL
jgi:hypothetical protein